MTGEGAITTRRRLPVVVAAVILGAWLVLHTTLPPPSLPPVRCGVDVAPDEDMVVMLSASWCHYCRKARAFLQAGSIRHCEFDIETTGEGRRRFAALPLKVVPVLTVGGETMVGFNRDELMQALVARGVIDYARYE